MHVCVHVQASMCKFGSKGRQCLYLFGLVSVWHLAIMMGKRKLVAAVFVCSAGIAAGHGCYCACCNWVWCDDCQSGCCQGTMCQPPNCRPQPTPPPTPPPQPGWQYLGLGCCPDSTCGGNYYYRGKMDGGLPACEAYCSSVGGKYVNHFTNDPDYCACYGPCDCSQGDSQTNCQRFEKVTAAMHVLANTTVNVI